VHKYGNRELLNLLYGRLHQLLIGRNIFCSLLFPIEAIGRKRFGGAAAFRPRLFVINQREARTRETQRGGVVCKAARGTEKPARFG
jgi:hypothetical protein